MLVFVYEYTCGGGLVGRPLPESLAREGWEMLESVVADLVQVPGVEVVATRDSRMSGRSLPAQHVIELSPGEEQHCIRRFAAECDWSLIIAPEFHDILLDRVRWVEEAGGRLLGPSSAVVATASDKLACGRLLSQAGVSAVSGRMVSLEENLPEEISYPAVLKPRHGAGSQHTFLIPEPAAAPRVLRQAIAEGLEGPALVEPYTPGLPASAASLVGTARVVPLPPGEQLLSGDGRFRYLGGRIPLEPELASRAIALGQQAVRALPGLRGYVGVDLVLSRTATQLPISEPGSDKDTVIEINPRLTTSYVGLRRLALSNLADALLGICSGQPAEPLRWLPGPICFRTGGSLA